MSTYDFYGGFTLEIRGENDPLEKLRDTYRHFETEGNPTPDLVCEASGEEPEPEVVLGGDEGYYGRDGDQFVIKEPWGERIVISQDWDRIAVSPAAIHHHVAYLIEFEVRTHLAERDWAMIHASGVQYEGQTFLFPAWRHAGKTNMMLSLLRAGGDYLADDRLWVHADGSASGYPLPVNVTPSNYDWFGSGEDRSGAERIRTDISDFVFERVDVDRSVLDKVVYFLTKYYVDVQFDNELVSVDELVPDSAFVTGQPSIDAMVFLRASIAPPDVDIDVRSITRDEAVRDIVNVNGYEWNHRLLEYFEAFDMLFPGSDRADRLEALMADEERIVSTLLERTPTYRALIPQCREWRETGIEDRVVERLGRLKLPMPAE